MKGNGGWNTQYIPATSSQTQSEQWYWFSKNLLVANRKQQKEIYSIRSAFMFVGWNSPSNQRVMIKC